MGPEAVLRFSHSERTRPLVRSRSVVAPVHSTGGVVIGAISGPYGRCFSLFSPHAVTPLSAFYCASPTPTEYMWRL